MLKLDRYISRNILSATIIALMILVFLEALFSFLMQLDNIRGNYQAWDVLIYTLLIIPQKLYELVPVSTLVGCLIGLGSMASNSELIVIRSAGISLWRIFYAVIKPSLLIILIGVLVGEYVSPVAERIAETRKVLSQSQNGQYTGEGLWHREGREFMYFNAIGQDGVLYGISRYVFDNDMKLQQSSFAKKGFLQGRQWFLEHVTTVRVEDENLISEEAVIEPWQTSLTKKFLKVVLVKPESLSISGLLTFTKYLAEQGLDTGEYELALWTKLLQPLSILSLVIVGISFVFGPLRSVSMGLRIFSGVITGLVFMIAQKLMGSSSLVFGFPPLLSVVMPIIICLIAGIFLLSRTS